MPESQLWQCWIGYISGGDEEEENCNKKAEQISQQWNKETMTFISVYMYIVKVLKSGTSKSGSPYNPESLKSWVKPVKSKK